MNHTDEITEIHRLEQRNAYLEWQNHRLNKHREWLMIALFITIELSIIVLLIEVILS